MMKFTKEDVINIFYKLSEESHAFCRTDQDSPNEEALEVEYRGYIDLDVILNLLNQRGSIDEPR